MAKVIGVGGILFKAKDPEALTNWYRDVLGIELKRGRIIFRPQAMAEKPGAATVLSHFKQDTAYFEPSSKDFMINLAVDDLEGVLASCAKHGVEATRGPDESMGKFARIIDPEGTSIELWEPKPMG